MTFASRVASSGVIWGRLRRDPIDPGGGLVSLASLAWLYVSRLAN